MKRKTVWRKLLSWRVDLAFLVLVAVLGTFYLLQPKRGAGLYEFWYWARHVAEQSAQGLFVRIAPPDLTQFEGEGLATFGSDLEFLGCDTAITDDQKGTHIWVLTLWRAREPVATDCFLVLELVPDGGGAPIRVEHPLGQQFVGVEFPTSQWPASHVVIDAASLPVGVDPREGYHQRIRIRGSEEDSWLVAVSPFLEQDAQGWLAICR